MLTNPAVVLVDMQNDFFTGPLKLKAITKIVEPLKRLVVAARLNEVPVVYSVDAHYPQDVEVKEKWGIHAIKGSTGAEVIADLLPDSTKDYIVDKRTYSAFFETGLDPLLRSLYKGEGARTVVLGGLHTQLCIQHTAADAFFRGYQIVVCRDGVEAFEGMDQEEGLKYLEYIYNAKVMTVNEVIREIVK